MSIPNARIYYLTILSSVDHLQSISKIQNSGGTDKQSFINLFDKVLRI